MITVIVSNAAGQVSASITLIVQRGIGAMAIGSTFKVAPPRGIGAMEIGSTFKVA